MKKPVFSHYTKCCIAEPFTEFWRDFLEKNQVDFTLQILRSMENILGEPTTQQNDVNQDYSSTANDITQIATNLANILARHYSVVQNKTQIYYGLGLNSGSDYHELERDAGNDAWIFFHEMLLKHFGGCTDTCKAKNEIIACLKNLELNLCASQVEMLDSTTGLVGPPNDIFWHNVDEKCANFVGRKKELAKLEENLAKQKSTTRYTVITSVSGMGGMGKTTLAREFAHHFREVYNGSVAWIPAENADVMSNEFSQIAYKLSISESSLSRDFANSIYEALLSKNDNVLFIFDNLDDRTTAAWIDDFLPNGLKEKRPLILITSRRRDVLSDRSNVVHLDVLSPEEALELVRKVLLNISSDIGRKLAETLQFFPLALQIALSEISTVGSSSQNEATEQYIQDFNRNHAILLDENENMPRDYRLTISASMKITLTKLETLENGRTMLNLLRVVSLIYPDAIERDFICQILEKTDPIWKILEVLCKYSILGVVSLGAKVYKIHRMIQYAIHQSSDTQQMKCAIQSLLTCFEINCVPSRDQSNAFNLAFGQLVVAQSISLRAYINHIEFGMKYLDKNKLEPGFESYYNKLKSVVYTYAAFKTNVTVEFMTSFMVKHFREEAEVTCVDYSRTVDNTLSIANSKAYNFLVHKYKLIFSQMDSLVVFIFVLRDDLTHKISKESLNLLQDMFSLKVDDIIHKLQPFSDEKFVHITKDSQESWLHVSIERLFKVFLVREAKNVLHLKSDKVNIVGQYTVTKKFGLLGPLKVIGSAVKGDLANHAFLGPMTDFTKNLIIFEELYNEINLTYAKLYDILFSQPPLYMGQIPRTTNFVLHLYKSVSLLNNGASIINELTTQDWNNLIYGYDWLFESEDCPLFLETHKLVSELNTKMSESELTNVKIYSLLAYLQKGSVGSKLISWFEFPTNFENKISHLGIVLNGRFYMDPVVSIVYAKSCDDSIRHFFYEKIVEAYQFPRSLHDEVTVLEPEQVFTNTSLFFKSCVLLHKICSNTLTGSMLVFPINLFLSYFPSEEGSVKLLGLFLQTLESDVLKENVHVIRLKDNLKQCFNLLDIHSEDFKYDFTCFLGEIYVKFGSFVTKPELATIEKSNGTLVFVKDHEVLQNILSKFFPGVFKSSQRVANTHTSYRFYT